MKYADATAAQARKPPLVVRGVKASAWADTWDGKADAPVDVGVRRVSEAELAQAREDGRATANRLHPGLDERSKIWADSCNQGVMHAVLGAALCQPEDATTPLFEMQGFVISSKLSTAGTLRLWDAVEELGITDSPLVQELDAEGAEALAKNILDDGWWNGMSAADLRRAGRLLQRVVEIGSGRG